MFGLTSTHLGAFAQVVGAFAQVEGSSVDSSRLGQTHTKQGGISLIKEEVRGSSPHSPTTRNSRSGSRSLTCFF